MERSKFLEWVGFRFVINHKTGEIHRIGYITKKCNIEKLVHWGYATKWWVKYKIKKYKKYNGCAFCYEKKDTTGK